MSSPGRPAAAGAEEAPRWTKMDTTQPLRERINAIKEARRRELGRRGYTTVETLEHIVAFYEAHHAAE